jgi:hypothetical protein
MIWFGVFTDFFSKLMLPADLLSNFSFSVVDPLHFSFMNHFTAMLTNFLPFIVYVYHLFCLVGSRGGRRSLVI